MVKMCKLYACCLNLLVICAFLNPVVSDGFTCEKQSGLCGCVFKNEQGEEMKISMADLDNKDGTPHFSGIPGTGKDWVYDLNLCTGFTETGCSNVTGCLRSTDTAGDYAMGKPGSEKFEKYYNKTLVVTYSSANPDHVTRFTIITLICDEAIAEQAKFIKENDDSQGDHYYFTIRSKYLCPRCGKASGGTVVVAKV